MCYLKITKWEGRLGNNIIQLKNAIQIALFYNYNNVIVPKHDFLSETIIKLNEKKIINNTENYNDLEPISDVFFSCNHLKIDKILFQQNKEETRNIIKKIFTIKSSFGNLDSSDLVIHIRSGDIFNDNPHPGYICPPLSYYINIIKNNNFLNIFLLTEDLKNPTITKLIEFYPNIIFRQQSLNEDIDIILSCKNIVLSVGSFVPSILFLSDNIKNIFMPSGGFLLYSSSDINVVTIDINNYLSLMTPWKNSIEQRDLMLMY
jgi:hypothetical protein